MQALWSHKLVLCCHTMALCVVNVGRMPAACALQPFSSLCLKWRDTYLQDVVKAAPGFFHSLRRHYLLPEAFSSFIFSLLLAFASVPHFRLQARTLIRHTLHQPRVKLCHEDIWQRLMSRQPHQAQSNDSYRMISFDSVFKQINFKKYIYIYQLWLFRIHYDSHWAIFIFSLVNRHPIILWLCYA